MKSRHASILLKIEVAGWLVPDFDTKISLIPISVEISLN